MSYQVARDGQTIGTFTEEELIEAVEDGKVLTSDDAWTEGMDEWITVEELIEVEEIEEEETPAATTKPVLTHLGQLNTSGHRPTSHYQPIEIAPAPVQPVVSAPTFHSPAMVLGDQPPIMVKPGAEAAAGRYGTAGTAIASLVLGILSIVGLAFTAVPAIICGHKALDKIRRTNGAFSGRGIATAGLTLGYLMLIGSVMFLVVKVILPATGKGH